MEGSSSRAQNPFERNDVELPSLLKEYEEFTKLLQSQLEIFKNEHISLRSELKSLVKENLQLSEELKTLQDSSLISPHSLRHRKDVDLVSNLELQLSLTLQEKDSAVEMWQLALKEVDILEVELTTYKNNKHVHEAHKELDNVKQDYSTALTLLENRLTTVSGEAARERMLREQLRENLKTLRDELRAAVDCIEMRDSELQAGLQTTNSAIDKIKELEKKLKEQSEELKAALTSRDNLESALKKSHELIQQLSERDQHSCTKVQEAITIVEEVMIERESALNSEALTKEENMHLQTALTDLIEDAGKRVRDAVQKLKEECNNKMEILLKDFKKIERSHEEKLKLLERADIEKNQLTDELESMRRDLTEPLLPSNVENKIMTAYRELTESERRSHQAGMEAEMLRLELKRLKESNKRDQEKKTEECRKAYEEIMRLQNNLDKAKQSQNVSVAHSSHLQDHIHTLQGQLDYFQNNIHHECDSECQKHNFLKERIDLYAKIQDIQKHGIKAISELQQHLSCQKGLSDKWQKTVKTITKKFEARIKDLHSEINQLKGEKRELLQQLNVLKRDIDRLQSQLNR